MKEKILSDLQDLILTLRSPNFQVVKDKWDQKRQRVEKAIGCLSREDLIWLEDKYGEWMRSLVDASKKQMENKK